MNDSKLIRSDAIPPHRAGTRQRWLACSYVMGLALLLTGCVRYQYRLLEPSQFAGTINKEGTRVEQPPLEYHLSERDSHLFLAISNPGDQPVTLSGSKSYVVAPRGETHPLGVGIIAPRSYIGVVLPPQLPVYRVHVPFAGFGYGYYGPYWGGPYWGGRRFHAYHPGWYGSTLDYPFDPWYAPGYAYAYPENVPHHWDWETGTVRLRLFYEQGKTNTFEHHFVVERVRLK